MHVSRLHKSGDEYLIAFSEEDAARLDLIEGSTIEFTLTKIEDPSSSLAEEQRGKIDREYESFRHYLENAND